MKTLPIAIISAVIVLASCSSTKQTAASEYDDVYYNPNKVERQPNNARAAEEEVATAAAATSVAAGPTTQGVVPTVQEPVYGEYQTMGNEEMSDYERYQLQKEAEMLGESYAPQGSEALYATQYQEYDSLQLANEGIAPVVVNNYNYYSDPNDYYYSSNLRRFSDEYYGWNYYDPYYTNLYNYTRMPMH